MFLFNWCNIKVDTYDKLNQHKWRSRRVITDKLNLQVIKKVGCECRRCWYKATRHGVRIRENVQFITDACEWYISEQPITSMSWIKCLNALLHSFGTLMRFLESYKKLQSYENHSYKYRSSIRRGFVARAHYIRPRKNTRHMCAGAKSDRSSSKVVIRTILWAL